MSSSASTNGVHVGVAGAEILTVQDQFGMLKQIGYLPESVHTA
jgi:hypothetical protein